MSDLNLLPSEAKFQAQRIHLKKIINNFLWVFGGFWLLLVVVVFGVFFIEKLYLNQVTQNYNKSLAQYTALVGNLNITQKIKYEAKIVASVLSQRFEYGQSMETIKNMFSEKVSVDNLQIEGDKKFTINGSVANGQDIDEVENKLDEINKGQIDYLVSGQMTDVKASAITWKFTMEVTVK